MELLYGHSTAIPHQSQNSVTINMPRLFLGGARCLFVKPALFLLVLALLVCNGAGGLACRLAGSLALATAALSSGFFQIAFVQSLYVFHFKSSFPIEAVHRFSATDKRTEKHPNQAAKPYIYGLCDFEMGLFSIDWLYPRLSCSFLFPFAIHAQHAANHRRHHEYRSFRQSRHRR